MVDPLVKIFDASATKNFDTSLGYGVLSDAVSCTVSEERNGSFELSMEYPIGGVLYDYIQTRAIIVAKPNPYDKPQAFRIYDISRPIDGTITVSAEHISYDLSWIPMKGGANGGSLYQVKNLIQQYAVNTDDLANFEFTYDENILGGFRVKLPQSLRAWFGADTDDDNVRILGAYGGELEFDNYHVIHHKNRGKDRGVRIVYGVNMTNLTVTTNSSSIYTHIYPFYYGDSAHLIAPGGAITVAGLSGFKRTYVLDCTEYFNYEPEVAELAQFAISYGSAMLCNKETTTIEASMIQFTNSEEYKNVAALEEVHLCDTVHCYHKELGVDASLKCTATEYDVLQDRYTEITLSTVTEYNAYTNKSNKAAKKTLADIIAAKQDRNTL